MAGALALPVLGAAAIGWFLGRPIGCGLTVLGFYALLACGPAAAGLFLPDWK